MSETLPDADFRTFILSLGDDPDLAKRLPDGLYALARPLMFHWTLIVGEQGDRSSYLDRWCYASGKDAAAAVQEWDGNGDPPGPWHRHPASGRRRPDGDPAQEHVEW